MVATSSFHAEQCCPLVSEHEAPATHICSRVCQFLIYSTFVLVIKLQYSSASILAQAGANGTLLGVVVAELSYWPDALPSPNQQHKALLDKGKGGVLGMAPFT